MKCEIRLSLSFGTRCSFNVEGCAGEFKRPRDSASAFQTCPVLGFCELKGDIDSSHIQSKDIVALATVKYQRKHIMRMYATRVVRGLR
jgi:hypothetical protein